MSNILSKLGDLVIEKILSKDLDNDLILWKVYNRSVIIKLYRKEDLSMKNVTFNVSERSEKTNKVRREGLVPGLISGNHLKNQIPVKMTKGDMARLLTHSQSTILSLNLNGEVKRCIVRELQRDIYGKVSYVDFQNIRDDEKIKVSIPVAFKGVEVLGAKKLNLEIIKEDVEVFGEADKLPEDVEFNVEALKVNDTVAVKDLKVPEGVKLHGDQDFVIAKVCGIVAQVEGDDEDEDK